MDENLIRAVLDKSRAVHDSSCFPPGKSPPNQARWVFLSETQSPVAMQAFLAKYQARMPKGPQYLDPGEAIANLLREGLGSELSYPTTLLLDARRVVRHAFVGRVHGRRTELMTALDRLVAIPR